MLACNKEVNRNIMYSIRVERMPEVLCINWEVLYENKTVYSAALIPVHPEKRM